MITKGKEPQLNLKKIILIQPSLQLQPNDFSLFEFLWTRNSMNLDSRTHFKFRMLKRRNGRNDKMRIPDGLNCIIAINSDNKEEKFKETKKLSLINTTFYSAVG
ncbi:hypothetical protein RCL_jg280.t1 [Rhizophagus clarus]|uniref:Uncharacterized protein n=1 Tax=Rhizophagus clarus TaxID=94130 RepID=A0A8H3LVW3_9GLOM|nr:hypothetical protein RCL_jg280.t1 [Rhizophagus clarus]